MSNEFVMVPRCTLENVLKDGSCKAEVHASFVQAQQDIRTLLSQPAEQYQGEPVALPERKGLHLRYDTLMPTFSKGWNACLDEIAKLGPLYTRPAKGEVEQLPHGSPANKAVFMALESYTGTTTFEQACLQLADEAHALRAQLAELEALHGGELGLPKEGWPEYHKRKMETLRNLTAGYYERKLAERDALLRHLYDHNELSLSDNQRIEAALSASAEPSAPKCGVCGQDAWACNEGGCHYLESGNGAPVEIDERADFEAWHEQNGGTRGLRKYNSGDYRNEHVQRYWLGWQARAALERKP